MIVLNSLFPIFALLVLGKVLKRLEITSDSYLQRSDRLIYNIFFPTLLFWKIGAAADAGAIDPVFLIATLAVVAGAVALSLLVIAFGPVSRYQAGSFSQSCYRFNTYIGVAVILYSLGEPGVAYFGVLIGLVIPMINVCAVSILIWYSEDSSGPGRRGRVIFRALVANPLIIGCCLGLIYNRLFGFFPLFIDNTLRMMSMVTLPLALLSIGGVLSFRGLRANLGLSLTAAVVKLVFLPLAGYAFYTLAGVEGLAFKVGMIFFCMPTSTALYVLSSQLKSDTELASSAIVVSTVLSFFSLSVALLI